MVCGRLNDVVQVGCAIERTVEAIATTHLRVPSIESLTNTNINIIENMNTIEKSCLFWILSPVPLLLRALHNRSDCMDILSTLLEAEELVAGYQTEYLDIKFGLWTIRSMQICWVWSSTWRRPSISAWLEQCVCGLIFTLWNISNRPSTSHENLDSSSVIEHSNIDFVCLFFFNGSFWRCFLQFCIFFRWIHSLLHFSFHSHLEHVHYVCVYIFSFCSL